MELEYLLINSDKEEKGTNQEYLNLNNVIEVETETTIKRGLVTGIVILLDIISITSQGGRSNI